jgi:hypothetical protein
MQLLKRYDTAVFQIVFQLFSFLSITTTGMVARACAEGDNKVGLY